ncbi:polysaccharide biosynthesis protein [Pseudomonas fluorescens]|uniref:polysaccharide biosynthesis protein n=1 Tax=Pseudomonas fluorescens TaxID=294 RepID=UPI002181E25E|nr:polysaccharide biosynthesis protein [Pseudomonas fluorescens]
MKIFVTGGAGSIGSTVIRQIIHNTNTVKMRVIFGVLSVSIIRGEARFSRVAAKLGSCFLLVFYALRAKVKTVNDSERVCAFAKKY